MIVTSSKKLARGGLRDRRFGFEERVALRDRDAFLARIRLPPTPAVTSTVT
jgi:hypothetical protein